jgi:hypothetical protein
MLAQFSYIDPANQGIQNGFSKHADDTLNITSVLCCRLLYLKALSQREQSKANMVIIITAGIVLNYLMQNWPEFNLLIALCLYLEY